MNVNAEAQKLQSDISDLERELENKKLRLSRLRVQCQHKWGETVYAPIIRKAYTDPGDPPGTMGVDWRGPTYVPREEKKRWTRTCTLCGLMEETAQTNTLKTEVPKFNEHAY